MGSSDTNEIVAALRKVERAAEGAYYDDSNAVAVLDRVVERLETIIDNQGEIISQLQMLNAHHEDEDR